MGLPARASVRARGRPDSWREQRGGISLPRGVFCIVVVMGASVEWGCGLWFRRIAGGGREFHDTLRKTDENDDMHGIRARYTTGPLPYVKLTIRFP